MENAQPYLFWIVAIITGGCAIAVVASQNIVRSATWLLFTLAGVSAIFFLLGADFVGAIQLLVYVGGTMVLVVFGVMLTAQGPFINMKSTAAEWAVSTIVGLLLFAVLAISALPTAAQTGKHSDGKGHDKQAAKKDDGHDHDKKDEHKPAAHGHHGEAKAKHTFVLPPVVEKNAPKERLGDNPATSPYSDTLGLGFLGIGVGPAHLEGGKVVRTHYFLPFLIVSVHLLVVLIGAAYLARAKRRPRVTS